jgi:hypothetical protein
MDDILSNTIVSIEMIYDSRWNAEWPQCFNTVYLRFAEPITDCCLTANGTMLYGSMQKHERPVTEIVINLSTNVMLGMHPYCMHELYVYYWHDRNTSPKSRIEAVGFYRKGVYKHRSMNCGKYCMIDNWRLLLIWGSGLDGNKMKRLKPNHCEPA